MLRAAESQAELAEAQRVLVDGLAASGERQRSNRADARIVAGRTFRLLSGLWTDTAHNDQSRIVAVEPFSEASFKLLEKMPELTPYLSAFDAVIVRGRDVSIRVATGGRSTLSAAELDTLVRDFRPR